MALPHLGTRSGARTWVVLFTLITLACVAGGYWYYRAEAEEIRREKREALAAIADLKAGQVLQWRKERLADADRVAKSPLMRGAVANLLQNPATPGLRAELRERLTLERMVGVYDDALLLTPDGRILLAADDAPVPVDPATKTAVEAALADRKPALSDFYRCPRGIVHVDAVAAMLDAAGHPLAVVVLRSDANAFLYPLIQSWPTPSRSAETLLVRREGEEVLFLNELRHQSKTALSLRQPLARSDFPAVQAVLGKRGPVEGKDYRGADVLADLRPIPGTPWFMVAKVDTSEILAEARYRARTIALVVALLILLTAALIAFVYRRRQAGLYRELYRSEREQREAQETLRESQRQVEFILGATKTGLDIIDSRFNLRYVDPEWARAYGNWEGRKCYDYFMGRSAPCPGCGIPKALETKQPVVTEEILVKEGNRPIQVTSIPYQDKNGEWLVAEVNVDITERKKADEGLRVALVKYKTLFESFPMGITVADSAGKILETNLIAERLLGVSPEEHARREIDGSEWRIVRPDGTPMPAEEYASVRALAENRRVENVEMGIVKPGGEITWISVTAAPLPLEGYGVVITYSDVTERKRTEKALRESEERFRGLAEAMPDAVLVGRDGRNVYANSAAARLLGAAGPEQLVGLDVFAVIEPAQHERARQQIQRALAGEKQPPFEDRFVRLDGSVVPVEIAVSLLAWQGRPALQVVARDITERKKAEEALKAERQRLHDVLEAMPIMVCLLTPDYHVAFANRAFRDKFGESHGRRCYEYCFGKKEPCDFCEAYRVLKTGKPHHWQVTTPDDATVVDSYDFPFTDVDGSPMILEMDIDITERKRTEEALRKSETLNRRLVEHLPHRVFVKDLNSVYLSCNANYARDLGIAPEQIVGKDDSAFFPAELVEAYRADDRTTIETGQLKDAEERYLVAGQERWVHTVKVPYRDEQGKVIGVLGIFEDITEHRQLEEHLRQSQKLEAVGQLAGGVAHDFNNILTGIGGYAELLTDQVAPGSRQAEDLREISNWCPGRRA